MLKYLNIDSSFRALAEPTRRAIVERLSRGPATVSDLARPFDMTLAAVGRRSFRCWRRADSSERKRSDACRTYQIELASRSSRRLGGRAPHLMEPPLDRLGELLAETEPSTRNSVQNKEE